MRLWPRSLFGRLALLLLLVIVISQSAAILLFRQDRAALLARQFSDTKLAQLQALRTALATPDVSTRRETLARLSRQYGVRLMSTTERPFVGQAPNFPAFQELERRLRNELGEGTELRVQPRLQLLWVRLQAGDEGYWVGLSIPRPSEEAQSNFIEWSLLILIVLLIAAYIFARYLSRPLRQLNRAVAQVGRGIAPQPLPERGPSEIVTLNRGFNQMLANLQQAERDRALLLAGVSHDLRTPLARLRLGIEMANADPQMREGMIDDVLEMDRIIDQFLDFARGEEEAELALQSVDEIVAVCVDRHRRAGRDIAFAAGGTEAFPVRATALTRLTNNLIDNAFRYGSSRVEVATSQRGNRVEIDVMDRGPGIPVGEVERLKRPFTRLESARTGPSGAGLGLAIVERIARLHGGKFDLKPREGGGTLAQVTLSLPRAEPTAP